MGKTTSIKSVRAESASMVSLWQKYPQLQLQGMSQSEYQDKVHRLNSLVVESASLRQDVKAKQAELNALVKTIYDTHTRLRATCKGLYGADSLQYSQAGGKRLSERKSPKRAAGDATAAVAAQ